ncbi:hypothetical protein WG902_10860 [Ramlibacter sp. PS3R-8]|uniref:hypothetical protein n=1 Tax=Ramlibacter sp. PS3R-8 TaxID=3133437 RepID=UPI0030B29A2C
MELTECFARRPYQGVDPREATLLFVGLDANYDANVERSPTFASILEYHADGAAFWRRYGVHHPFLLPEYRGDGRRYHSTFARIGFEPRHAGLVSFVELMHKPTVGRSKLEVGDFDPTHLRNLSFAMREGNAKYIFVSAGVVRLMRMSGAFPWLRERAAISSSLPVLYEDPARAVYLHLHFSNYGKFQLQLEAEARAIRSLLRRHEESDPVASSQHILDLQ